MKSIVSRTLPVGKEHEVLQKLESAGLNGQDAQRVIESRDNHLAQKLVDVIRSSAYVVGEWTMQVDHDQPEWQSCDPTRYTSTDVANADLFPVTLRGKSMVTFHLLGMNEGDTGRDVLDRVRLNAFRLPLRDEAETFITTVFPPVLQSKEIIAPVGPRKRTLEGDHWCIACLKVNRDRGELSLVKLRVPAVWGRSSTYCLVVSTSESDGCVMRSIRDCSDGLKSWYSSTRK